MDFRIPTMNQSDCFKNQKIPFLSTHSGLMPVKNTVLRGLKFSGIEGLSIEALL